MDIYKMETDRHFLIYKPYKMVSQFITNSNDQRKKRFLGELYDFPENSMAVGRLDEKSEGLLLITTNGKWSNHINKSPDFDKEYYVQLDGIITVEAIKELISGLDITVEGKEYNTKKCKAYILPNIPDLPETKQRIRDDRHGPTSWISITLTEGKFRQVRKMCAAVGFPVLRLARVRIGDYSLETLQGKNVVEITHSSK